MQDLFVGDFNINVQGATNNTLGQNGQGVCAVIVHFDHTALCDISITLTAPSGQTITLVGPIGQFCNNMGNVGTDWNVTFVPCGSGAVPDPGFTAQWSNNQAWGANNNYNGSYYPFAGCLQNLSGPVNGNWVLTVTDGQGADTGNLYDYEIIFCDPSGINCVSCDANAGALTQSDVMACQGAPELTLDLPPSYTPPVVEPPASDYTYSYLIGGTGGVLQAITSSPDLSGLPAGNYTVCGLSYLTAQQNLLPMINGVLTVTQLTNQLNSNTPPFCGNVSTNCVNVTIFPIPPDEEETVVLCAPECHDFLGDYYCQTGDYTVEQMDANGCQYNAILHLTINTPTFRTINEIVCPGNCATHPSFPDACGPGLYQITLVNARGCDSILTLNLTTMNVNAVIQPPDMLTCTQNTVQLSGVGSTLGSGTTYLWTPGNGGLISGPNNLIAATAAAPGVYKLLVCRTISGVSCCDSTTVNVTSSIVLPNTPVINGSGIICTDTTQLFSVDPVVGATHYTWTVPPWVTILSGQGDTAILVQWTNAMDGNICVTADNACGSGLAACSAVTVASTPTTPSLSGELNVCRDSIYTYSADTIPGISNILWQVTGGNILSGNGTYVVAVQWTDNQPNGTVCAFASNVCGQSDTTCLNSTINAVPSSADVFTGSATRCVGTIGQYSISPPISGATGYVWSVPSGGTILSNPDSTAIIVRWDSVLTGNVCVHGINGCGAGNDFCFPVKVLDALIANAGVDTAVCGVSVHLAAVPGSAGVTGNWTVIAGPGWAQFANPNSANTSVSVNLPGTYDFQWRVTNGGCILWDTVQVQFNTVPLGGIVQANCSSTNDNFTVSFPVSGGTVPYTIPGGTLNNGIFTSEPIPNGQSYMYAITDSNGCVSPPISGVYNCNCASNAGQMTLQLLTACPGNSVNASAPVGANFDSDDVGAFVLHNSPNSILGTILGQNTTGVFSLTGGMAYGVTYYISYVVGNNLNGLPDPMDPCISVTPGQPVVFYNNPTANAGADIAGCGLSLAVQGNTGQGNGFWTINSTPLFATATLEMPQNASTQVSVSDFGDYSLTYTVTSNGCIGTDEVVLHFGDAPVAGIVTHACDSTFQTYQVVFPLLGGQAPYSINGQPMTGSNYTSSPVISGSAYSFVITDALGCISTAITGSFTCNCATYPGQVSQTTITACQSDSISVQFLGGQILDANDVGSFVLHTGPGNSLGTILAENHSGKFGYWATMTFGTTYYISVVAGNHLNGFPDPNDPCYAVSAGQPIVFLQNPTPNAGSDFVVCGLTAFMGASPTTLGGKWTQVSGPSTAIFSNNQSRTSQLSVPTPGTYIFRWTEFNGICAVSDDVQVVFWNNPVVSGLSEVCNSTNTGFTVSFSVNNGSGTYSVVGLNGTFNGPVFTSVMLPNNSNYSFSILDAFGCQSAVLSGNHSCNCSTNAGSMPGALEVFCADQPATASWNNNATLDGDDVVQFILHDQAGSALGTVYATQIQPTFTFGPGLQTGITYYISAIAGNNQGGAVNLNDPCLHISPGTPVQWKPIPTATIAGTTTICSGSSTNLTFTGTGTYPLLLTYNNGTGTPVQLSIPNAQSVQLPVTPVTTTVYSLISVADGSAPTCAANLNASTTVTVNQPVNSGIAGAPVELCSGTVQTILLRNQLSGEDGGGVWTETSLVPSLPGAFTPSTASFNTSGQPAGTYSFQYAIQGVSPCPNRSTSISVLIHPTPMADAGAPQTIDCHQDSVVLGGPGTSIGSGIQHRWLRGGIAVGNAVQLVSTVGGNFTLSVTNAFGCVDEDTTSVVVNNDIPIAGKISVKASTCFGENNGSIVLDSIVSNHQPVMFSLNGGPFETTFSYHDLEPGTYLVTLLDNNGCEWSTSPLIVTEPPLLSLDLGTEIAVTFGDSVFLQANVNVPLSALQSLLWNPLLDTLHAQTFTQTFLPFTSKYVTLEVVDTNGCAATARVLVRLQRPDEVYIANIFQPGSTGLNDRLTVFGGRGVKEIESFRVFDRWGSLLFETLHYPPNDPVYAWDGTYKGQMVLPGVYVYTAMVRYIDGETQLFKGDVTIFR
jgi:subtilisin-like proprotein convertase family protein